MQRTSISTIGKIGTTLFSVVWKKISLGAALHCSIKECMTGFCVGCRDKKTIAKIKYASMAAVDKCVHGCFFVDNFHKIRGII